MAAARAAQQWRRARRRLGGVRHGRHAIHSLAARRPAARPRVRLDACAILSDRQHRIALPAMSPRTVGHPAAPATVGMLHVYPVVLPGSYVKQCLAETAASSSTSRCRPLYQASMRPATCAAPRRSSRRRRIGSRCGCGRRCCGSLYKRRCVCTSPATCNNTPCTRSCPSMCNDLVHAAWRMTVLS